MTQLNLDQLLWQQNNTNANNRNDGVDNNMQTMNRYPQVITTQTRPYIILESRITQWSQRRVSLVLWLNSSGTNEYSTHIAIIQDDGTADLIGGHYYQDIEDAVRDYNDRL